MEYGYRAVKSEFVHDYKWPVAGYFVLTLKTFESASLMYMAWSFRGVMEFL